MYTRIVVRLKGLEADKSPVSKWISSFTILNTSSGKLCCVLLIEERARDSGRVDDVMDL